MRAAQWYRFQVITGSELSDTATLCQIRTEPGARLGRNIQMDFNCAAEQLACEFPLNNGSLYRHQSAVNAVRNNLALYFCGFKERESQGSASVLL